MGVELLLELLEQDPRKSATELANELSVDQSTVSRQLKVLGKQQKTGDRSLTKSFLWKIVTEDEK